MPAIAGHCEREIARSTGTAAILITAAIVDAGASDGALAPDATQEP